MTEIPNAHITRYGISFDGQEVPGMIIQGGISVKPGGGSQVNTITVTFLAAKVQVDDPTLIGADSE